MLGKFSHDQCDHGNHGKDHKAMNTDEVVEKMIGDVDNWSISEICEDARLDDELFLMVKDVKELLKKALSGVLVPQEKCKGCGNRPKACVCWATEFNPKPLEEKEGV